MGLVRKAPEELGAWARRLHIMRTPRRFEYCCSYMYIFYIYAYMLKSCAINLYIYTSLSLSRYLLFCLFCVYLFINEIIIPRSHHHIHGLLALASTVCMIEETHTHIKYFACMVTPRMIEN